MAQTGASGKAQCNCLNRDGDAISRMWWGLPVGQTGKPAVVFLPDILVRDVCCSNI